MSIKHIVGVPSQGISKGLLKIYKLMNEIELLRHEVCFHFSMRNRFMCRSRIALLRKRLATLNDLKICSKAS